MPVVQASDIGTKAFFGNVKPVLPDKMGAGPERHKSGQRGVAGGKAIHIGKKGGRSLLFWCYFTSGGRGREAISAQT